ncbi:MAG: MBL fold metallo-hydrolase [Spirochaetales bacterium]|nr:MBL fold metallo-hydrolase [Spirochaetales bacterium]
MKITVLGSGTSHGVPVIGCDCEVCRSADPRDKRTRSSVLIEHGETVVLVDTGTDFRFQALRAGIRRLDAVLMTHAHADHLHGLDDTRSLTHAKPLPVYGSQDTLSEIRDRFDYVFTKTQIGGGKPNLLLQDHRGDRIGIGGLTITPVPVKHGDLTIFGYRIGNFAYITDCSGIPRESFELLEGVKILIINALRYRSHATHFTVEQAIEASKKIGAREVWLTHLCHDVSHKKLTEELNLRNSDTSRILPSYDGLEIIVDM